jgi:L-seryl-tRNA(Ser) seleniumtransferase
MQDDPMKLPRVDRVLAHAGLAAARAKLGRDAVADLVRAALEEARRELRGGGAEVAPSEDAVAERVEARAAAILGARVRPVINATGVLLHTNLGRAPLGADVARDLAAAAAGYCSLEINLDGGKRGGRGAFALAALRALTGAEAAVVVNNCAAAVMLLLAAVARGREVVVSRGELVEIGGGFRVPEIMAESGAKLVEVGTTNKTRIADYERALEAHPGAAAILRVHQSNFRQVGFVERPEIDALAALAARRGVWLLEDQGAGALSGAAGAGLEGEPTVTRSVAAGVHAIAFSTDKLLGGPQGGAVVGARSVVDRLAVHPLARAMRLGRLPMVALESTLAAYLEGRAERDVPVVAMAAASATDAAARAERWVAALASRGVRAEVVASVAEIGGGAGAGRELPSAAVSIERGGAGAAALAALLRAGDPAVLARVEGGAVLLDARTVLPGEDAALLAAVAAAARRQ